jgi:hypothetical protein
LNFPRPLGFDCSLDPTSGPRPTARPSAPITDLPSLSFAPIAAFYTDEGREFPDAVKLDERSFMLRDREYGVAYEGFAIGEVDQGRVVEVRDPVMEAEAEVAAAEARMLQADLQVGPEDYFTVTPASARTAKFTSDVDGDDDKPEGESEPVVDEKLQKESIEWAKRMLGKGSPELDFREKTWRFLDDPSSSPWALRFTMFMLVLIVFSTATFCIETLPQYYEHEMAFTSKWFIMEASCIACFTLEFLLRLWSTPKRSEYFNDTMNCVDLVAILPFWLELILTGVAIPGLSVFRVVRLVRVFRLFKVSRGSLTVFATTMSRSSRPLYMLVFFTSIATIIFSSLIYYVERGKWNDDLKMWMREYYYYCPVKADASTGPAVKGPTPWTLATSNWTLDSGLAEPCKWIDPATYAPGEASYPSEAWFSCPYSYKKNGECETVYEQSPYDSIPTSFWWCLVTMTTVGYGDVVPTQPLGKILAAIVMIFGILVIALPITVIGSNFSSIYAKFTEEAGMNVADLEAEKLEGILEGDEDDDDDVPSTP